MKHKKTGVVIGVHLPELLEREGYKEGGEHSGIPKLVDFLVTYLREHGNSEQHDKLVSNHSFHCCSY